MVFSHWFSNEVCVRFESTFDLDGDLTSLDEYISRMKEDQDTILFLPGDSRSIIL